MPVIRRVRRQRKLNDWLAAEHAGTVGSQFGEDGILAKIFQVVPAGNRWCVEFGAWEGTHFSNTRNLIRHHGWRGVLIEADTAKFTDLVATYRGNRRVTCLNEFVDFAGEKRLDRILPRTPVPRGFDLLSIDIDGNDYHVWQAVEVYRPKVVVIEFNPSIPNDTIYVQDADMNVNQGASLRALIQLGKRKGYELISTTPINAIFVLRRLFPLFDISDNDIDLMHDDSRFSTYLLQMYDGTLRTAGCTRMLWHDMEIDVERLQVLPPERRYFPGKAA
jgi:hypothetical protein